MKLSFGGALVLIAAYIGLWIWFVWWEKKRGKQIETVAPEDEIPSTEAWQIFGDIAMLASLGLTIYIWTLESKIGDMLIAPLPWVVFFVSTEIRKRYWKHKRKK